MCNSPRTALSSVLLYCKERRQRGQRGVLNPACFQEVKLAVNARFFAPYPLQYLSHSAIPHIVRLYKFCQFNECENVCNYGLFYYSMSLMRLTSIQVFISYLFLFLRNASLSLADFSTGMLIFFFFF